MQKRDSICERSVLEKDGIDVIRRTTGGRAVLHWDDLTYSFVFSKKIESLGNTINSTYDIISKALEGSLNRLGIKTQKYLKSESLEKIKSDIKKPCFLSPNRNEIMVNGSKLIGSAQKRGSLSVLQHGSIPLNRNFRKVIDYLSIIPEHKSIILEELIKKAVSLEEIIDLPEISVLEDSLTEGFCSSLSIKSYRKNWTFDELKIIEDFANSSEFKEKWLYY